MNKQNLYFQHDYDAHYDPKMVDLMSVHGLAGIGAYWCIIEDLHRAGGKLKLEACKSIAFALHVDCKCITSVIQDFDLFQTDNEYFWSETALKRLNKRLMVSESRKKAAEIRWSDANAMQMDSKCNADAVQMQCKIPTKDNSIKDNNININISNDILSKNEEKNNDFYEKVKQKWNEKCKSFGKITVVSKSRKAKIKARVQDMGGVEKAMEVLNELFAKMEASDFLKGQNSNNWKATFDWLFENDKNWLKVIEGNYDRQIATGRNTERRGVDTIATSADEYSTTF